MMPKSQSEKPVFPFLQNPTYFYRRQPLPPVRRRVPGRCRYPNMGFRPFHPRHPNAYPTPRGSSNFAYHRAPNTRNRMPSASLRRSPFPNAYPKTFDNRNNQLPSHSKLATYDESEIPFETLKQTNEPGILNERSECWVEALAPRGRKYYYNARTRETTWTRPINVRIINTEETSHSIATSGEEKNNHCTQQQLPFDPNANHFRHANFSLPPPFLFPPPQILGNPSQAFLVPPAVPIQSTANFNFSTLVPTPVYPITLVSGNMLSSNEINFSTNIQFSDANLVKNVYQTYADSRDSVESIATNSSAKLSIYSVNDQESITPLKEEREDTMKQSPKPWDDSSSEKEDERKSKSEESAMSETEYASSEKHGENKTEKEIDRTRPISSTPVPGTCWQVVWTGDGKVFFFDSKQRISVWDRPTELMNRSDVDKFVEKCPLFLNDNPIVKEVRKTTSDGSDIIKKLKKEDKKDEQSDKENDNELRKKSARENNINKFNQLKPDEIPHERRVTMFKQMLEDHNVSALSSWEKELHKISNDQRYTLLTSKERKKVFENYIQLKLKEEKKDRKLEFDCQKETFISLLKEARVTPTSRFNDIALRYAKDKRFKIVEKMWQKENIFNQHIAGLIEKDQEHEKRKADQKKEYFKLLSEKNCLGKNWSEVQKIISKDKRYKTIQGDRLREELFKEYIRKTSASIQRNDKEERVSASIRNREEEVKQDLSMYLKDREREQRIHKNTSAVTNFKALLEDLIKNSETSWQSAKKKLREDSRWDLSQCLESEKLEELFNEHIDSLNCKKKNQFHLLLNEIPNLTLKTSWLDIRKAVLGDPRCIRFSSSERKCEKEFKDYLREKSLSTKNKFKELLKETKLITYKSKSLLSSTNHLKEIEKILSQDRRYLNLDCMPRERRAILLAYIDKLYFERPKNSPEAISF